MKILKFFTLALTVAAIYFIFRTASQIALNELTFLNGLSRLAIAIPFVILDCWLIDKITFGTHIIIRSRRSRNK